MQSEIQLIDHLPLPFNADERIFNDVDEATGEILGEAYSYNDWIEKINSISGINDELLGIKNGS